MARTVEIMAHRMPDAIETAAKAYLEANWIILAMGITPGADWYVIACNPVGAATTSPIIGIGLNL